MTANKADAAVATETCSAAHPAEGSAPAGTPLGHLPRFSEELDRLITAFDERTVRLRDVLEVTQSRGYLVLLILLGMPFCTPLPMPGVSLPFGLVIAFIGLRLALGQKPWLPVRMLDTRLPSRFFPGALKAARRIARWLDVLLKPRLVPVMRLRPVRHGMGAMIFASGLLMILPLPIPFSNGMPAFAVLLLASAMLEEDGYFAIAGGGAFLVTVAFFGAIFWGGAEAIEVLRDALTGLFEPEPEVASRG